MTDAEFRHHLESLKRVGASTVHEALGQRGYVDSAIAPLDPHTRIAGRAFTVDSQPADNLMMHYAISLAQPGDIIVVDYKRCMHAAATGDIMAFAAQSRGIGGMVVDGAIRDAAQVVAMGFPVFCRGVCVTGPTKKLPGKVNVPITFGGCTVNPGDIVVGDRDGLVVIPAAEFEDVARLALERDLKEAGIRKKIEAGATTVELFGLGETLRKLGL